MLRTFYACIWKYRSFSFRKSIVVRIEKFLHEATYPCVGITYTPKTENWFLKSPPRSEHILGYNMLTCKVIYSKVHEGFLKFVIKKLKVFHGLFAIQFLKSLMCTRMQSQFLLMVFPFFILQISFYLLFFVENRTENYPKLIFICKKIWNTLWKIFFWLDFYRKIKLHFK